MLSYTLLLLFIHGLNCDFATAEELVSVHSMHGATKDEDIFTEAWKTTAEYSLQW
jgi:hypothetical protein